MQSVPKIVRDRLQAAPPALNHPEADLLTAFAEQALPEAERAAVLDHLAHCGDCRHVVALALPPIEAPQTVVRPVRRSWLTWPALRWGFVAAGVVIVASIGVLQLQRSKPSQLAVSTAPGAQVARNEAVAQPAAAPLAAPTAKPDSNATMPTRFDELSKATGLATEGKIPAAGSPSLTRAQPFSSYVRGPIGGPKPPSQFQNNYNVQQKTSNDLTAPAANRPEIARQSAGASAGREIYEAPAASQAGGDRFKAPQRDESADSQLFADQSGVSKTKLPVTQPAPGQIAGQVVDPSGAAVANARITVTPTTSGKSVTAVTDARGTYLIAGLSTGSYKAQAQASGFNTTVQNLNFDANRPSTYNFMLNVGSVSETVEVSAENSQAPTETATMGGPAANSKVSSVPSGRSYSDLASLSPGLVPRWTVSASGTLQRSFDQGKSWQNVNVNIVPTPSASVEIARESSAKSARKENDADKKLLRREVASPVFRAVTAAGLDVWAGGSAGALYHSLDGGNHWSSVVPESAGTTLTGDIISLEFSNAQNGKITTSTSEAWTTTDAGQTWQRQ